MCLFWFWIPIKLKENEWLKFSKIQLNLPLVLALGQLENAEKLGMICRDEIMEQITFYPVQIFDTFCKLNVAKK